MSSKWINKIIRLVKIFFCLFVGLMAFSVSLFAQQDKIDSLNKVLMKNDLTDSIRVKSLIQLATISGRRNAKLGDSLYHQSLTLAHRSKNLYGEIRALIGLARFQRRDGNFSASRASLLQALQLAQRNHVPNFVADAVNDFYQDCFLYPTEDHVKELKYALYYLKLAEQYEIQALVADACTQTGFVFADIGKYPIAIDYHNRALKILEQTEYRHSLIRANSLFFLGETYKNHGDYNQSIQRYKQSFQLAGQLNSVALTIENEISL